MRGFEFAGSGLYGVPFPVRRVYMTYIGAPKRLLSTKAAILLIDPGPTSPERWPPSVHPQRQRLDGVPQIDNGSGAGLSWC
jgi:hypothetical protein